MIRKEAIEIAAKEIGKFPIISANGYISRDLFESNEKNSNFYMIGSMGCTHGRASLSEGQVDPDTRILQCPWHGGKFELETGIPSGSPAKVPIKTYKVEMSGEEILVGWM